jgi:hypothetical protein
MAIQRRGLRDRLSGGLLAGIPAYGSAWAAQQQLGQREREIGVREKELARRTKEDVRSYIENVAPRIRSELMTEQDLGPFLQTLETDFGIDKSQGIEMLRPHLATRESRIESMIEGRGTGLPVTTEQQWLEAIQRSGIKGEGIRRRELQTTTGLPGRPSPTVTAGAPGAEFIKPDRVDVSRSREFVPEAIGGTPEEFDPGSLLGRRLVTAQQEAKREAQALHEMGLGFEADTIRQNLEITEEQEEKNFPAALQRAAISLRQELDEQGRAEIFFADQRKHLEHTWKLKESDPDGELYKRSLLEAEDRAKIAALATDQPFVFERLLPDGQRKSIMFMRTETGRVFLDLGSTLPGSPYSSILEQSRNRDTDIIAEVMQDLQIGAGGFDLENPDFQGLFFNSLVQKGLSEESAGIVVNGIAAEQALAKTGRAGNETSDSSPTDEDSDQAVVDEIFGGGENVAAPEERGSREASRQAAEAHIVTRQIPRLLERIEQSKRALEEGQSQGLVPTSAEFQARLQDISETEEEIRNLEAMVNRGLTDEEARRYTKWPSLVGTRFERQDDPDWRPFGGR